MSRYIDADKMKIVLQAIVGKLLDPAVDTVVTEDVVKVVRCKDCKYWRPDTRSDEDIGIKDRDDELWGPGNLCVKHLPCDELEAIEFGPDEWCNFGERKDK